MVVSFTSSSSVRHAARPLVSPTNRSGYGALSTFSSCLFRPRHSTPRAPVCPPLAPPAVFVAKQKLCAGGLQIICRLLLISRAVRNSLPYGKLTKCRPSSIHNDKAFPSPARPRQFAIQQTYEMPTHQVPSIRQNISVRHAPPVRDSLPYGKLTKCRPVMSFTSSFPACRASQHFALFPAFPHHAATCVIYHK